MLEYEPETDRQYERRQEDEVMLGIRQKSGGKAILIEVDDFSEAHGVIIAEAGMRNNIRC